MVISDNMVIMKNLTNEQLKFLFDPEAVLLDEHFHVLEMTDQDIESTNAVAVAA